MKNLIQDIKELKANNVRFNVKNTDFGFTLTTESNSDFIYKNYNKEGECVWTFA